ncbi:MAG: hypothetical protein H0U69_00670 [Trueperaceae bacterium]|nr:hypothetical protein [Trueperaceae bacterium]
MNLYWGDLHAHCAVSYGHGSAERALANARGHLDFCSITGHAFWPDMPHDLEENDETMIKHYGGFAKLRHFWAALQETLERTNTPGSFVTFPSYEWHSMRHGDHNVYVSGGHLPLLDAATPADLERTLRGAGCDPLVLPHHIGYDAGYRGISWPSFDAARSPLLEIFSNHGSSEADDAPYPYHHNMGPRFGHSTARDGLVAGHRFGFQAGSDTHDGYPGHYGHGRVGVYAERLDRASIWEALRARRTIASTGARIRIDVEVDGAGPGQQVERRNEMHLRVLVEGTDALVRVEWITGGPYGWTVRPLPLGGASATFAAGRYKLRVETGWGRHGTRSTWHARAAVRGGALIESTPYFRYSGHDNAERDPTESVLARSDTAVEWMSRALANAAGGAGGTHHHAGGPQTMLLDVDASVGARIEVQANGVHLEASLEELVRRSMGRHVGGLSSAAVQVTRAVPEREFSLAHHERLAVSPSETTFGYVRVIQADGQAAWASPIFFD